MYAQESAATNNRKTITAMDVLHAVRALECEEIEQPVRLVKLILKKFRKVKLILFTKIFRSEKLSNYGKIVGNKS